MKRIIAIILGLVISIPTIIEGGSVLIGRSQPDQIVLKWLVIYNVMVAFISFNVVFIIWLKKKIAINFSLIISLLHLSVFIILVGIYNTSGEVAVKSVYAMLARSLIWIGIYLLIPRGNSKE
jgi:hypothetical protein